MTLLPVVTRELAVQARRKGTYLLRLGAACAALIGTIWIAAVSPPDISNAQQGKTIFACLTTFSFIYCLLAGVRATSDCLSEEKREGTLGLLFLTDLKALDVVLGKVVANSLSSICAVVAIIPIIALALLLGGVSLTQVALFGLVQVNTLFLSLSAGAVISAISKNERRAMLGTLLIVAAIAGWPFPVAYLLDSARLLNHSSLIWVSPVFTFAALNGAFTMPPPRDAILEAVLFQNLLAWLMLFWAGKLLQKSVDQLPNLRFQRFRTFLENHIYGTRRARNQHRARLLDRNAFLWLAAREKVKPRYAWVILGIWVLGWISMWFSVPRFIFDIPISMTFLFLAHFIFKIWAASEVCSRLIEDRRSGALELLLSTPLSVQAIARGQSMALRHLFFGPIAVLLGLELLLAMASSRALEDRSTQGLVPLYFTAAASTFLLDLWAMKWFGMWHSLFAKSIERVFIKTMLCVLALPWIVFFGVSMAVARFQPDFLQEHQAILIWCVINLLIPVYFGANARWNFLHHFRLAATQRFDSTTKAPPTFNFIRHFADLFRLRITSVSSRSRPIQPTPSSTSTLSSDQAEA